MIKQLPIILLVASVDVMAAEKSTSEIINRGDIGSTVLSLAFIILLIIGLGWLVKKFNAVNIGGKGAIQILAGVSLGSRERVVLVEANGQKLLLGVAAGSIRTLHTYESGDEAKETSFEQVLEKQEG